MRKNNNQLLPSDNGAIYELSWNDVINYVTVTNSPLHHTHQQICIIIYGQWVSCNSDDSLLLITVYLCHPSSNSVIGSSVNELSLGPICSYP